MALTNTQYDEVMRDYQQRQLKRQRLIASRKAEVYQKAPELSELDGEIASISVSRARRLLDGDAHALSHLKEQLGLLSQKKTEILTSLGYPADYFQPPYTCPDCQDTGYIGNKRCHCLVQASIDLVYAQSNLRDLLQTETFPNFSLDYYPQDLLEANTQISSLDAARNALNKCRTFTENFDTQFENILLFGDTGTGKTFLSHCIARELLDTGHSVIYFSASQLFDILAQNTFSRDQAHAADYRNIFDCDLLIIDDLGTEFPNSFNASQFFVCLNERINRRKSTLISSNLNLLDIATIYSERIFSRISYHFILLHLFGPDIRNLKKLG